MLIADLARQYNKTISSSESTNGTRGVEKLVSSIRDLTAGNVFEGTVNSVKNGQVVLGLSNGTELTARLDAAIQLVKGQSMFFQVKANTGDTIAIRPYTVDGAGVNLTLLNALKAANLPASEKFLNMANAMMHEHLPIDKNSMAQMARILMANPDMSVNTLVQMKKLDIPITAEMVAQFENYMDDTSAVHKALDRFVSELPAAMAGKDMPLEQLKSFDSQLLQFLAEGSGNENVSADTMPKLQQTVGTAPGGILIQAGSGEAAAGGSIIQPGSETTVANGEIVTENTPKSIETSANGTVIQSGSEAAVANGEIVTENMAKSVETSANGTVIQSGSEAAVVNGELVTENTPKSVETSANGTVIQSGSEAAVVNGELVTENMAKSVEMSANGTVIQSGSEVTAANGEFATENTPKSVETPVNGTVIQQGTGEFATDVTENMTIEKQTLPSQEKLQRLLQNLFGDTGITSKDSPAELLQKLSRFVLRGEVSKAALLQLFSSKDMQQFLRDVVEQDMYLTPADVADADKVQKLYERLESKTQNLQNLLNNAGLHQTPLAQTIADVHSNVEFMNQLNQNFTYVQIPLKMAGQNASGQLYVYTNKRDLKDPDRDLTAFLHLDLDHLGSTDVSVKLHHKNIDTKFYMDNDASYALVKRHMPELERRLRAKGFNCKIYVENEGKKVDFVEDFLKKDAPATAQLHRYSFDVRA